MEIQENRSASQKEVDGKCELLQEEMEWEVGKKYVYFFVLSSSFSSGLTFYNSLPALEVLHLMRFARGPAAGQAL